MSMKNVSPTAELVSFPAEEIARSASGGVCDALQAMKRDREIEAEELELLKRELATGLREVGRGEFSERSAMQIAQRIIEEDQE